MVTVIKMKLQVTVKLKVNKDKPRRVEVQLLQQHVGCTNIELHNTSIQLGFLPYWLRTLYQFFWFQTMLKKVSKK